MINLKEIIKSDRITSSERLSFVKKYRISEEQIYATLIDLAYEKGLEDGKNLKH